MTNRERFSATTSSVNAGRWEISTVVFPFAGDVRYMTSLWGTSCSCVHRPVQRPWGGRTGLPDAQLIVFPPRRKARKPVRRSGPVIDRRYNGENDDCESSSTKPGRDVRTHPDRA